MWSQGDSRGHPKLNVKMMDGSRAGLTCGGRASRQCCWQSALQPPNRKWLWYPPWPQGWWTSWWALAAWQTWQQCLCHSWLCHKLRPRLVRKRDKQIHRRSGWGQEIRNNIYRNKIGDQQHLFLFLLKKPSIAPHRSVSLKSNWEITYSVNQNKLELKLKLRRCKLMQ